MKYIKTVKVKIRVLSWSLWTNSRIRPDAHKPVGVQAAEVPLRRNAVWISFEFVSCAAASQEGELLLRRGAERGGGGFDPAAAALPLPPGSAVLKPHLEPRGEFYSTYATFSNLSQSLTP